MGRPKSMLIRPFIATYGGLIRAGPPEIQPNVGSGSEEIPAGQLTRTPSSQSWTTWSYRLSATPSQWPHSPASGANSASIFSEVSAS